jgi:GT2 family glycosyltransferase
MSRLTVSVVICAYSTDRWHDLAIAIQSIDSQSVAAREIVVVVDHNPVLLQRVQACFGAQVKPCENTQTPGLSGGRNTGIANASGDIVAFLDDDAAAAPDWIERLIEALEDPQVLGVGGAISPNWMMERPGIFPREFDWVFGCSYLGMPEAPTSVRNVIGCNMAFRREVFDTVGGFRTEIGRVGTNPVGCEETEFCIRLKQMYPAHTILYDPAIKVHHRVSPQRTTWTYFRSRCFAEGMSKAVVAGLVGSDDGLSSERNYALRVLPIGVVRGLSDALFRRDHSGLLRSLLIVAGLAVTVSGYCVGILRKTSNFTTGRPSPLDQSAVTVVTETGSD